MSQKIYFYTRTGTCKKIAETYHKDGSYKVQVVDDPEDRFSGIFGLLKAGLNSMKSKDGAYRLVGDKYQDSSDIVLITPVWASKMPPAFRSFLKNQSFNHDSKILVITVSAGGDGRRTFREIVDILENSNASEIRHKDLKQNEIK